MRHPFLLLSLIVGLGPWPAAAQEWCEVVPDPFPQEAEEEAPQKAETLIPVVDLLALAIPEAGSLAEVRTRIQGAVGTLNRVLATSEVPGSVRLLDVTAAPPSLPYRPYEEGAQSPVSALAANLDVQRLRDEYGADLVTLIVPPDMLAPAIGGIAFIARTSPSGYSVVRVDAIDNPENILFAHEIGHNLGLVHDKANAGSDGGPYSPRAYGHWGQFPDGRWFQDVMSYGSACPGGCMESVPFFGNPEITFRGAPMGVVGEREGAVRSFCAVTPCSGWPGGAPRRRLGHLRPA